MSACENVESVPSSEIPGEFFATVKVSSVIDGDTIRIVINDDDVKVRILGLDAPESGGYKAPECWGAESKDYATTMLEDQTVHLYTDSSQGKYDQYERLLAYVVIDETKSNFSVQSISDGQAKFYKNWDNPIALNNVMELAEAAAKSEGLGLWGSPCFGNEALPEQ